MSEILPNLMPSKKLPRRASGEQLMLMVQETCIAEFVHMILFVLGFGCVLLWDGPGGWMVAVVYNLLGNVPFILIQRYNRPRLQHLMAAMRAAAGKEKEAVCAS